MRWMQEFWQEEGALSTVEYGILLAGLTVLLVVAILALFGNVGNIYNAWANWLEGAPAPIRPPP